MFWFMVSWNCMHCTPDCLNCAYSFLPALQGIGVGILILWLVGGIAYKCGWKKCSYTGWEYALVAIPIMFSWWALHIYAVALPVWGVIWAMKAATKKYCDKEYVPKQDYIFGFYWLKPLTDLCRLRVVITEKEKEV